MVVAGATSKTLVAALHPHVKGNASLSWHRLLSDAQYVATAYAVVGKLPLFYELFGPTNLQLATFGVKR